MDEPLIAFLRARLDDDQRELDQMTGGALVQGYLRVHGDKLKADIKTKRRILDEHGIEQTNAIGEDMCLVKIDVCVTCSNKRGIPCRTVRLLAAPYEGEDGYKERWKP